MEKRVHIRCKIVDERTAELITIERAKIKNISIGGICLETSQHLNTKDSFRVEITSSDNEKITPTCEVSWSSLLIEAEEKEGALSIYEVGLKFIELTDSEKRFLEKYISELTK